MDERELDRFIARYVAMWHEPDPVRRRQIVADMFAPDAENFTRRRAASGIDEIYERVTNAHDEWVVGRNQVFEPMGNTDAHHHLAKFSWRMRPRDGGAVVSIGLDVFVFDSAGRIQALYQFIEPSAS
jgi:hypothetical protein